MGRQVGSLLRVIGLAALVLLSLTGCQTERRLVFEISIDPALETEAQDGRLLLLVSSRFDTEPRFHAVSRRDPQPFFGVDVDQWRSGRPIRVDSSVLGYPLSSLDQLPAGEYNVQAVLNVYTTFQRSDGHVVKLPMDHWEGQRWSSSPGNLHSLPRKISLDGTKGGSVSIELTERIPPIEPPADTRFVKHVKVKSPLLSEFWGRDMFLGAIVLLPDEFEERPEARYPVAYLQGHFMRTFRDFREEPPAPDATGRRKQIQERGYDLYRQWTSGRLPRFIVVVAQDPNPFYDDGYAVNSQNVGPYGDALIEELYPFVEEKYRAIGEPWARTTYGGSTGGWRALAQQVFYPDFFNGAWVFCPDPVDFRYFQMVNIYEDENAYYPGANWKRSAIRPWMRSTDDQVLMNQRQASILEHVLGNRGRSGDQMDIFQAVYGPVGEDGYPRLLYDKLTGKIDPTVAAYWKENYDLRYILERDWKTLGPKLQGKLRIFMGDTDTYYLEEATRLLEEFLESTTDPPADSSVAWGKREGHCWTGAPAGTSSTAHYLPAMAEHIRSTAPRGADLRSWDY